MKKILYILMLSCILVSCGDDSANENEPSEEIINTGLESSISDEEVQGVVQGESSNSQYDLNSGIDFNQ